MGLELFGMKWSLLVGVSFLLVVISGLVTGDLIEGATGHSYQIRNRKSSLYVTEVSFTTVNKNNVEQWEMVVNYDPQYQSYIFHVFPIDKTRYLIANKRTGQVLVTSNNAVTDRAQIHQYWLQEVAGAAQTWYIQREAGTPNGGAYYLIKNEKSGKYLVIADFSNNRGTILQQLTLQPSPPNRNSQLWYFKGEEDFPVVVAASQLVPRDVNDIGAIPRITTWVQPQPSKTTEVLIGQVAIPYILVKDPALTLPQQSTTTSYYILKRYAYWQQVYFYEYNGVVSATVSLNIPVGLVTNNANAIQSILQFYVNENLSIYLGFRPSLISAQISSGLKVRVNGVANGASTRLVKLDRSYNSGLRQSEAVWYRQDHYVLERLNGASVLEWVTRDANTVFYDVFKG